MKVFNSNLFRTVVIDIQAYFSESLPGSKSSNKHFPKSNNTNLFFILSNSKSIQKFIIMRKHSNNEKGIHLN